MTATLTAIFTRDLKKLRQEIELYSNENNLWKTAANITNSAGNLCLHLVGNLNAYIGAALANSGYVRNRPLEFSQKDIPRQVLLQMIDDTIPVVEAGLGNISPAQMQQDFPVLIWEQPATYEYTLIHLSTHLSYHLGQINYHRRLLDQ